MNNDNIGADFRFHVYKTQLDKNIIKNFEKLTHQIFKEKFRKNLDHQKKLVGVMREGDQYLIPKPFATDLWKIIDPHIEKYIIDLSRNTYKLKEVEHRSIWSVKQLANDYNPAHYHNGTMSGIIYLKTPEQVSTKDTYDGSLSFIHGNFAPKSLMFNGVRTISPIEGDMYLFPSWLIHTVYPFLGDGERISLAFNIDFNLEEIPFPIDRKVTF